MTAPLQVTAMVFTLDEEANLPFCLESLATHFDDVIVVDSFSSDRTVQIARERGARVFQRAFDGFGSQRNWALENTQPKYEWVLMLDADERVTDELVEEVRMRLAAVGPEVAAFRVARRFYFWGRWLRHSSLYPSWVVRLVHRDRVRYVNRGHAETQQVEGDVAALDHDLIDENHKGVDEWLERQSRYARKEAEFEIEAERAGVDTRALLSRDPLERRAAIKRLGGRIPGRALAYFAYAYVIRRGYRDGVDGLMFCTMRATYQQMIAIKKYDLRRRSR